MDQPARTIAGYNPFSFIVNGVREPIISSVSATVMADALLALLGISILGLVLSARALRYRLSSGG